MTHADPAVPFSSPAWLTPARIAAATCMTGGGLLALPSIAWCDFPESHDSPLAWLSVIASTMLLTFALSRRVLRAQSARTAWCWCTIGAWLFGMLNAGISLGLITLVSEGRVGAALGGVVVGTLFGFAFGGPIGLAYGVAYGVLLVDGLRARVSPSWDSADRALTRAGAWLTVASIGAFTLVMKWLGANEGTAWLIATCRAHARSVTMLGALCEVPLFAMSCVTASVGLALFAAGLVRQARRRRWLRRVASGAAAGFAIEPATYENRGDLLPLLHGTATDGVLVRLPGPSAAAYRDGAAVIPLALVPAITPRG